MHACMKKKCVLWNNAIQFQEFQKKLDAMKGAPAAAPMSFDLMYAQQTPIFQVEDDDDL